MAEKKKWTTGKTLVAVGAGFGLLAVAANAADNDNPERDRSSQTTQETFGSTESTGPQAVGTLVCDQEVLVDDGPWRLANRCLPGQSATTIERMAIEICLSSADDPLDPGNHIRVELDPDEPDSGCIYNRGTGVVDDLESGLSSDEEGFFDDGDGIIGSNEGQCEGDWYPDDPNLGCENDG